MEMEHLKAALDNLTYELNAREDQLVKAQAKAAQAQADLRSAQERVQEVLQAIDLLESIVEGTANRPETTNDYVVQVLKEAGGALRDSDILSAIQEMGWRSESSDQLAVLRTILSRMINEQVLVRIKPRVYRLREGSSWHTEPDDQRELSQSA